MVIRILSPRIRCASRVKSSIEVTVFFTEEGDYPHQWRLDLFQPAATVGSTSGGAVYGTIKHVDEGSPHEEEGCGRLALAGERSELLEANDVLADDVIGELLDL